LPYKLPRDKPEIRLKSRAEAFSKITFLLLKTDKGVILEDIVVAMGWLIITKIGWPSNEHSTCCLSTWITCR
jgi:hypothetical protein